MSSVKQQNNEKLMTIVDHLEELRKRLIVSMIVVFIATVIAYFFVNDIRRIFTAPADISLIYINLPEAFITNIKLSIITGIFFSLPVLFYQGWCFVLPAFQDTEKKTIFFITVGTLFFFLLGVFFAYQVILPISVQFFMGFAMEDLAPTLTYQDYISYSMGILFGFGLVFELPIVVLILSKLGIVSAAFLKRYRMIAVVIIFVVSAVITPPDVVSQVLMALPLILLYEFSIILARLVERRRKKMGGE